MPPGGTFVQTKLNGALVACPSLFVPSKNSTRATAPALDEAVAVSVTLVGVRKTAPATGLVIPTVTVADELVTNVARSTRLGDITKVNCAWALVTPPLQPANMFPGAGLATIV